MEFSGSTSTFRGGPLGTGDQVEKEVRCVVWIRAQAGTACSKGLAFAPHCPRKGPDAVSLDCLPWRGTWRTPSAWHGQEPGTLRPLWPRAASLGGEGRGGEQVEAGHQAFGHPKSAQPGLSPGPHITPMSSEAEPQ